ncbi:RNA helicase [Desertihabitans brevis]|uniref:RNA helicase n=1 Tax=Desertihabitans brevis TaxID=2268447 RepID=A0A367Z0X5_9ACTN|nr:DEAD/DEAH box helicase [Desertihabitans brevis]RCK71439.1 RNA helicase [Desertihabitans brevis]
MTDPRDLEELSAADRFSRFRQRQASPALADFADTFAFPLDEYQLEACRAVEQGSGVLVAAPTGAGKTVVGEFAVHLALLQGRKAFYTTPIKALSNQKYADLVRRHGAENVGLLTGDTSHNSEAPVVVMTTEVLRNMIYAGSRTLDNLGYVVMDEVHYLADRFRGPVWEEVIIGLADSVQVVALSATVSNAEEFGEWLGEVRGEMALVVSERRPVPLFQHVLVGRELEDLFADVAPTAVTDGAAPERPDVNPRLLRIAKSETREVRDDARRPRGRSGKGKKRAGYGSGAYGGAAHRDREGSRSGLVPSRAMMVQSLQRASLLPAIVFVFSRLGCDTAVRQVLGSGISLTNGRERAELTDIAEASVAGLSPDDLDALGYSEFLEGLLRGVAAHHAGMLPALKECVEQAFVRGLVKVVFATETLALGINMPARSVVLEKLVKFNGENHVDITPGEYTQLTGRAGRRGIDVEGHAVVQWAPGLDPRAVAGLASRRTYPLRSSFRPTYNMAVNLVGSVGRVRARTLLEQSFAQFQTDRAVVGMARNQARNRRQIASLMAEAECERGDFAEYARLRERISLAEAEAARDRKSDKRAEALQALLELRPGDLIRVPAGKSTGWAVVIDPGIRKDRSEPTPTVLTEERHVRKLSLVDFPVPTTVVGRVRVPKHFDVKQPSARRSLAAAFSSRLSELDPDPSRYRRPGMDAERREEIGRLRAELQAHPCHRCPDRDAHARLAERALRLERDNEQIESRVRRRTSGIATQFDRICQVLGALGYLVPPAAAPEAELDEWVVGEAGRMLSRIYSQLDLVTAECIRRGLLDGLDAPQLAAVLSTLVYESRRTDGTRFTPRMPDSVSEEVMTRVRAVWREVSRLERDARLERGPEPDVGFARAAAQWTSGRPLGDVLEMTGLTAGDFVRWVRQVLDLADQVAGATTDDGLRATCREVVASMRRGVVAFVPDEEEEPDDLDESWEDRTPV